MYRDVASGADDGRRAAPPAHSRPTIGETLSRMVAPVFLSALFFLVFTPVGIILRLFRPNLLQLKRDPESDTYWTPPRRRRSSTDMRSPF